MAQGMPICELSEDVLDSLKKFRYRKEKNIGAIVCKIDKATHKIILDEQFDDIEISDLVEELPHHQPRYIYLSYAHKHADGRVSYPLIFIFVSPQGCQPELQMMYAGSKTHATAGFPKVVELRSLEELTEEKIKSLV